MRDWHLGDAVDSWGALSTWWTSIVKNSVGGRWSIPDVHHGTNNSWGSERGPDVFPEIRAGVLHGGSPQWNTVGESRHVVLRAILFYLCLNILKHCAAPSPTLLSLCRAAYFCRPLTVFSNVRLSFRTFQKTWNCQWAQCIYRLVSRIPNSDKTVLSSRKGIFSEKCREQRNKINRLEYYNWEKSMSHLQL